MKINEFSKSVSESISSLKGSPRRAFIGGAAALAAPLFVKNDDRGYGKSALITTPVVGAATLIAPDLFAAGEGVFTRAKGFSNRWRRRSSRVWNMGPGDASNFEGFRQAYDAGEMDVNSFRAKQSTFFSDFSSPVRNLEPEIDHVINQLDEVLGDPSKHFMLANVIYSTEYRSMSAAEIATRQQQILVNPNEMRDAVLSKLNSSNPDYIRQMNFRLGQMRNMVDRGPFEVPKRLDADGFAIDAAAIGRRKWNNRYVRRQLYRQDREVYREVLRAVRAGKIDSKEIELVSFDRPSDKTINKIVGLNINRRGSKGLSVGLTQADGMVFLGKDYTNKGFNRKVGNRSGIMRSEIWAIRNSGENIDEVAKHLPVMQMWSHVDPVDDTFQAFADTEFGGFRKNKATTFLRSNSVVMDPLSGFGADMSSGWLNLRPQELIEERLLMMKKHKLVPMGSPGSFANVMQTADVAKVVPFGDINYADQAFQLRWMKPIHVDNSALNQLSGFHAPHSRTKYLENLGISEQVFGTNVHGFSSHLKNLVEILPTEKDGLTGKGSADLRKRAAGMIMREWQDRGMSGSAKEAGAAWASLRSYLLQGNNLRNVRKIGYLGEGTTLLLTKFPDVVEEKYAYIHKDSLRVDLDKMKSTGEVFGNDVLLGTLNHNLVTAQGDRNRLVGWQNMPDGRIAIEYDKLVGAEHGKADHLIKGHTMATTADEAAAIREFTNVYHGILNTGDILPDDVASAGLGVYTHNKARALDAVEKQTADLLRRLESTGQLGSVDEHVAKLKAFGYQLESGSLVFDPAHTIEHTPGGQTILAARREKHRQAVEVMEQMFEDVGSRVRAGQLRADTAINSFRHAPDQKFLDFAYRNFAATDWSFWNTTSNTIGTQATLTFDMAQHMSLRGQDAALKDIWSRSRVDGNIGMTEELMRMMNDGDLSSLPKLNARDAFGDIAGSASSADFRAGTVLDPANEIARKNWGLQLGEGEVLPVLGHEAYGGKINMYGDAEFAVNKREQSLLDAVHAYGTDKYSVAKEEYLNNVRTYGWGKQNYMRAPRVDPLGIIGRLQNAPSPFGHELAVGISSEDVRRIRDENIRDLVKSGDAYAIGFRHPVSSTPALRVYHDPNLDAGVFGLSEGARGIFMADNDGDALMLSMLQPHTKGYQQAKRMAEETNSLIHHEMKVQRMFEGPGDFTQLSPGMYEPLSARWQKEMTQDVEKVIKSRTSSGAVGRLSNVLTEAMMGLEANNRIFDPKKKVEMQWALWETLRQAPIRMAKKEAKEFNLQRAMDLANDVERGMRDKSEKGFNRFFSGLQTSAANFGKEVDWSDEMMELGLNYRMVNDQGKINPLLEYIRANEDHWRQYHQGIDERVAGMARGMTASDETVQKHFGAGGKALDATDDLFPYLNTGHMSSAGRGGSTGANMSADMLREFANEAKSAASGIADATEKVFRGKAGVIWGAGLALGALAGVMTTSLDSPTMPQESGNRYRPEDMAGTSDHIQGEPLAGSMAPTGPPRRVVAGPRGVPMAVVAPIHNAVDLEVRTKSPDRSRAAEFAKQMARMATDGDSTVTINYRSNPRSRSLRSQDRVRERNERGL